MTAPTALITGAAAGIGDAIARALHADGWHVGLADIDAAGAARLRDELGPDRAFSAELDVTDRAAWDRCLADFCSATGRPLELLVNNAGVLDSGPFEATTAESHRRMIDVNVLGLVYGCHAAHPHFQGAQRPCVVNLASASAIYGQPALATYSASKFAVRGLTEALNLEWEGQGIRVVDIWPLFVRTAMLDGMQADSLERLGVRLTPEDVARTVLRAVAAKNARRVHWTVGFEAALFAKLVRMLPPVVARFVVRRLAA